MPLPRRAVRWIVGVVAVGVLALVGGPFVYINFIKDDAPDRLTFEDAAVTTTAAAGTTTTGGVTTTAGSGATTTRATVSNPVGQVWTIANGTQVGYRVKEILFGQSTEGVGRTSSVTGSLKLDGSTVTAVDVSVDMATITSDDARRDRQFNGRIMAVAQFPTATFRLATPIALGTVPPDGTTVRTTARGELTLRGTTKPIDVALEARRANGQIQVLGNYTVVFSDWGIPSPSTAGISVEDRGLLELLLVFAQG